MLEPKIVVAEETSCKPNTSEVPKNCSDDKDTSVHTRISCLVLNAVTILDPIERRKNPAVLVKVGCQFSGSGPISASTFAKRIRSGSKVPK